MERERGRGRWVRYTRAGSIFNDTLHVVYVYYIGRETMAFTPYVVHYVVKKDSRNNISVVP